MGGLGKIIHLYKAKALANKLQRFCIIIFIFIFILEILSLLSILYYLTIF